MSNVMRMRAGKEVRLLRAVIAIAVIAGGISATSTTAQSAQTTAPRPQAVPDSSIRPRPDVRRCPTGWRLVRGRCVSVRPQTSEPTRCPAGTVRIGRVCLPKNKTVLPNDCGPNRTLVRGRCVRKKSRRPVIVRPTCPRDTQLKDGKCVKPEAPKRKAAPVRKSRRPVRAATPSRPTVAPPQVVDPAVPTDPIFPGEVLAGFPLTAAEDLIDAVAARYNLARADDVSIAAVSLRIVRFRFAPDRAVAPVSAALQNDPDVLFSQPVFIYQLAEGASAAASRQYSLVRLEIPQAHTVATGKGVVIAVLDTDFDLAHPTLIGRVAGKFDALGGATWDKSAEAHGTAMASLIVGGGSLAGVAPEARILAIRVFGADGKGGTPRSDSMALLKGANWAIEAGAAILNLSFAGPKDPLFKLVLNAAARRGILSIAAAGNHGPDAQPAYPAAYASVLAVTATDDANAVYSKANRGDYVTVAAPGVNVLAAQPGNAFSLVTGTSASAAQVSGIAALLLEQNPSLAPKALFARLQTTARDLGPKGHDPMFGHGLVDPPAALGKRVLPTSAN